MRGAWIEINVIAIMQIAKMSLPVRGAWIEIGRCASVALFIPSLPVRGAWIEIMRTHQRSSNWSCRSL